ncbi:phospholipase ABHD3-like [Amblyomma americanum]
MRRMMGVVAHSKVSTKSESLQCPPCAAQVVYDVLAVRKPVCRNSRLRRFLSVQMEAFVKGYFRTTICSTGANLQRLVGCLYHRWLLRVNNRRELLVLSDQGLVPLDWLNEDRPGSQSRPWRSLLPALAAVGFPGLVVNGCCCGGVPLTVHRITYAASVSDFPEGVSKVRKPYPCECLLAAVVSLGGLLLSLHLCQRGPHVQLDTALAVSPPLEPAVAARTLSNPWGFNRLLNACITRGLVGRLRDSEEVVLVANENRRSNGQLYMVQRPLVFLESPDDTLDPERTLPEDEVLKSPWLAAVLTPRGDATWISWTVKQWARQSSCAEHFVAAFAVGLRHVC